MNLRNDIHDLAEAQAMLGMVQNEPEKIYEWYWIEPEDLFLVEEELVDKINALEDGNIKGFVESKCAIINDYSINIEWIKTEIARLQNLMDIYQKKVEKARNSIDWIMQASSLDKMDTKLNKISYRKSESVSIADESKIPAEFWKEKITKSVDKIAIKEAIKWWKEVAWATIEIKQNLQIK